MKAIDLINNAYRYSRPYRFFIKMLRGCCFKEQYHKILKREIDGKWPDPRIPDLPDNIQWQNMGCESWEKVSRSIIAWVISTLIIISAFIAILIFKNLRNLVVESKIKMIPVGFCTDNKDLGLIDVVV